MNTVAQDAAHVAAVQVAMQGPHPVYVVWRGNPKVEHGAFTTPEGAHAQIRELLLARHAACRTSFEDDCAKELELLSRAPHEHKGMGLSMQLIMVKA